MQGAQEAAGEGARRRAGAALVDGQAQAVAYVLADQGAVDGGGEEAVGRAVPGEFLDACRGGHALAYGAEGVLEGAGDGLVPGAAGEEDEGALDGAVQALAARQPVDDDGVRARREAGDGVAVGLGRALDGQLEDELGLPADE